MGKKINNFLGSNKCISPFHLNGKWMSVMSSGMLQQCDKNAVMEQASREEKQYSINKAATTRAHNGYNEQDEQKNSNNAITHKEGNNNVIKSHEMTNKKLANKIKRKSRKSFSFSNNANYSGKFITRKLFVPFLCIVILLSL